MSPVFAALKERHPNLRPQFYMSDCADAFWNSWRAVFEVEGVTRLYCIWHVWRAWNAHIMKVVDDARRSQLREMLLKLTQASTPHAFYSLYNTYAEIMNSKEYMLKDQNKKPRSLANTSQKNMSSTTVANCGLVSAAWAQISLPTCT
uniref:MULE transposase domain-containing protein n=1 Tax=Plectus sambesii TaxID=2011161 RepID=A0A914XN78_9BILA